MFFIPSATIKQLAVQKHQPAAPVLQKVEEAMMSNERKSEPNIESALENLAAGTVEAGQASTNSLSQGRKKRGRGTRTEKPDVMKTASLSPAMVSSPELTETPSQPRAPIIPKLPQLQLADLKPAGADRAKEIVKQREAEAKKKAEEARIKAEAEKKAKAEAEAEHGRKAQAWLKEYFDRLMAGNMDTSEIMLTGGDDFGVCYTDTEFMNVVHAEIQKFKDPVDPSAQITHLMVIDAYEQQEGTGKLCLLVRPLGEMTMKVLAASLPDGMVPLHNVTNGKFTLLGVEHARQKFTAKWRERQPKKRK